jgi:hypothetical protein
MYITLHFIPPVEGNIKEAVKPLVTEDHKTHKGYADLRDRMVNSYSIRRIWKKARYSSSIC